MCPCVPSDLSCVKYMLPAKFWAPTDPADFQNQKACFCLSHKSSKKGGLQSKINNKNDKTHLTK